MAAEESATIVAQRATVLKELIKVLSGKGDSAAGGVPLVDAWQLERQVFLYAQGVGQGAWHAYTFKAVEMLHYLESDKGNSKGPSHDLTQLPWLPPSVLHGGPGSSHSKSACHLRWDTMRRLQEVSLKVPDDVQGGMRCRRCGSNDLLVETHQTRAADEGMTQYVTCKRCGAKW